MKQSLDVTKSWGRGCAFKIDVIAKADVEKLILYSKEHDSKESDMGMDYDTGHSSMVYSRGNILLGKGIFLKSLRVSKLRRYLVNLLF